MLKSVPSATITAATKCAHGGTSLRPKSSTPRNAASRKNAVSALVRHERRDHVRRGIGIAAPVGTELERHHDSRHDAHPERDRKDLDPERRDPEVYALRGGEVQPFQHRDVGREPDRERREQEVKGDDERELDAGEQQRIERHREPRNGCPSPARLRQEPRRAVGLPEPTATPQTAGNRRPGHVGCFGCTRLRAAD